uniref:Uncharacterized protein n=1 Tax=Heterorhabditis bacteriophora TaxID=37862 RepID=A0A1I7XBP5_HETBA
MVDTNSKSGSRSITMREEKTEQSNIMDRNGHSDVENNCINKSCPLMLKIRQFALFITTTSNLSS